MSKIWNFNEIHTNRSELKVNGISKSLKKRQERFLKLSRENSPTVFKEKDFSVINSQAGMFCNLNNRFSF